MEVMRPRGSWATKEGEGTAVAAGEETDGLMIGMLNSVGEKDKEDDDVVEVGASGGGESDDRLEALGYGAWRAARRKVPGVLEVRTVGTGG